MVLVVTNVWVIHLNENRINFERATSTEDKEINNNINNINFKMVTRLILVESFLAHVIKNVNTIRLMMS